MKEKELKTIYVSPQVKTVEFKVHGMLCGSGGDVIDPQTDPIRPMF